MRQYGCDLMVHLRALTDPDPHGRIAVRQKGLARMNAFDDHVFIATLGAGQ